MTPEQIQALVEGDMLGHMRRWMDVPLFAQLQPRVIPPGLLKETGGGGHPTPTTCRPRAEECPCACDLLAVEREQGWEWTDPTEGDRHTLTGCTYPGLGEVRS